MGDPQFLMNSQDSIEDRTAQNLAMEVVITRSISMRRGFDLYINLIDLVGDERATELIREAQEIFLMVTPTE